MKTKNRAIIMISVVIMIISMIFSILSCVSTINQISAGTSKRDSLIIAARVHDSIINRFLRPIIVSETMANDSSLAVMMKKGAETSPQEIEAEMAAYMESIRTGFGYQMVFGVSDETKAYYTYNGLSKFLDPENDPHDIWYKRFCEEGKRIDLDVDTDEENNWSLSVFVNVMITDEQGDFVGICGVGVSMEELQELLRKYEQEYNIKINLIDPTGLIQVDTDGARIEVDYLDNSLFATLKKDEYHYQNDGKTSTIIKFMDDLDWYLVVEDNQPNKIDVLQIVLPSIVVFAAGLLAMAILFTLLQLRQRRMAGELSKTKKIAVTDGLTGLYNRRAYENDSRMMENPDIIKGTVIVALDLNGLKEANDNIGHNAGDELLIGAAECIKQAFGEYGKIYRTGGDEFAALLTCTAEQLNVSLDRLDKITAAWRGELVKELSIAHGCVVCADYPDISFEEIEHIADQFMYDDKAAYYKRTGKDRRR